MSFKCSNPFKRLVTIYAFTTLFVTAVYNCSPLYAESLVQALTLTYQNNPTLKAERYRLRAIDEEFAEALSGWRPEIDIAATASKNRQLQPENENKTPFSSTLSLTQSIYSGGRTVAEVSVAKSRIMAGRARLISVEQNVFLSAITAYMDVVRDESVFELNVSNEQVLLSELQATQDRFDLGEVTRTDVAQAESRLAGSIAERRRGEGALKVSQATYRQVIGKFPGKLVKPDVWGTPVSDEREATKLALERNPRVLAAIHDEAAAKANIISVSSGMRPKIDLTAKASHTRDQTIKDRNNNNVSVGAALTIPLYQKGFVSARVRGAKQLSVVAQESIDVAKRAAVQDATSSWQTLLAAQAQIDALVTQIQAALMVLEGISEEATVGSRTLLDILDAEQELLNAQVGLVIARRDEVVAYYGLIAAVGGLTADGLALPIDRYDETEYYNSISKTWWGIGTDASKK